MTVLVEKALSWIETVDFAPNMPSCFKVNRDHNLIEKLKSIPLLSTQVEALELVGKSALGDNSVDILLSNLFASRAEVITVNTGLTGNVMNGYASVETMLSIFLGVTTEKVLIPVICGKNHWCSVMMDLSQIEVFIYDPMNSTYGVNIRPLIEKLVAMVPDFVPRKYRTRAYQSDLGVQVDNYNCGIYMLVAFEIFCGAESLSLLSKKEIQYLRYRYLCMCI
ncbi:hypothetical protein DVH05_010060 [Phytophthora capsici]|nr:hypothetical protein DVH05_010060 [Phytophthora capsici]